MESFLRVALIATLWVSLPVSLFGLARLYMTALDHWPMWGVVVVVLSHVIVLLGIASLFDRRQ